MDKQQFSYDPARVHAHGIKVDEYAHLLDIQKRKEQQGAAQKKKKPSQ